MPTKEVVARRFKIKLTKLEPRSQELTEAKKKASGIKKRLHKDFSISSIRRLGSHTKRTAIRIASDLDLLSVLRRNELTWGGGHKKSDTILRNIRQSLKNTYPTTSIRKDGQAVVIEFGQGRHSVDVVPAVYETQGKGNYPIYRIPDGSGGWMETAPDLDTQTFKKYDRKARGQLSRLVRLFKGWAIARTSTTSISGIHLERVFSTNNLGIGVQTYQSLFLEALHTLHTRDGRALRDPLGISGYIPLARTERMARRILKAVTLSLEHAEKAMDAQRSGDSKEAVRQWRIVFNKSFPSY